MMGERGLIAGNDATIPGIHFVENYSRDSVSFSDVLICIGGGNYAFSSDVVNALAQGRQVVMYLDRKIPTYGSVVSNNAEINGISRLENCVTYFQDEQSEAINTLIKLLKEVDPDGKWTPAKIKRQITIVKTPEEVAQEVYELCGGTDLLKTRIEEEAFHPMGAVTLSGLTQHVGEVAETVLGHLAEKGDVELAPHAPNKGEEPFGVLTEEVPELAAFSEGFIGQVERRVITLQDDYDNPIIVEPGEGIVTLNTEQVAAVHSAITDITSPIHSVQQLMAGASFIMSVTGRSQTDNKGNGPMEMDAVEDFLRSLKFHIRTLDYPLSELGQIFGFSETGVDGVLIRIFGETGARLLGVSRSEYYPWVSADSRESGSYVFTANNPEAYADAYSGRSIGLRLDLCYAAEGNKGVVPNAKAAFREGVPVHLHPLTDDPVMTEQWYDAGKDVSYDNITNAGLHIFNSAQEDPESFRGLIVNSDPRKLAQYIAYTAMAKRRVEV